MNHYCALYDSAEKRMPEGFDLQHCIGILFQYPEGEWFAPTNKENDAYSICEQLELANIICMRRLPQWSGTIFKGVKIEFKYSRSMLY